MKETFHKKLKMSRQKSFNLLLSKTCIEIMYAYIVRHKNPLENRDDH